MPSQVKVSEKGIDQEWVQLILTARELGISVQEIREFFLERDTPSGMVQRIEDHVVHVPSHNVK